MGAKISLTHKKEIVQYDCERVPRRDSGYSVKRTTLSLVVISLHVLFYNETSLAACVKPSISLSRICTSLSRRYSFDSALSRRDVIRLLSFELCKRWSISRAFRNIHRSLILSLSLILPLQLKYALPRTTAPLDRPALR